MLTLALLHFLTAAPDRELPNGAVVEVELKVGDVTLQMDGRLVPCTRGARCAQLRNGRRVKGHLQERRFVVEETP